MKRHETTWTKQEILEAYVNRVSYRFFFQSCDCALFAAKTGTSKGMRDNWCVGFTSEYTVAAWVGNFNGDPMWNVSGITGATLL